MEKILVVEDNESVRESIVELLETQDYEVIAAENGAVGLKMAFENPPSLILCDIMMPVMDGLEVVKGIRENTATSHIPFVFLSAKSQSEDLRKGMNMGADDYLTKPFKAKDLFATVETRLLKHEQEEKSLELKMKSKEPLSNSVFSGKLLSSIQYLIDEARYGHDYFEERNKEELKGLLDSLAKAGEKIKRTTYNTIMFQQLELAKYDESIKHHFTNGTSSNLEKTIRQIAQDTAEVYRRPHDLYFKDIDEAKIPMPMVYFERMLNEIMDNALKYSYAKSLVSIEGKVIGQEYHLSVTDHGQGMDAEQLTCVGKTPVMDSQRFSLGLFLVRSIIKLNRGALIFNAELGKGTTVKLKFKL